MSLRARLADERGLTLPEMLVTMAILGIVMAAIVTLFLSASHAELNMNNRFQAQQQARLALDSLRREIHCASSLSGAPGSSITISLSSSCPSAPSGGGDVTWCALGSSPRYALWRAPGATSCTSSGATCTSTGCAKKADYLTTDQLFTAFTPEGGCLRAKLSIDLPVSVSGGGGATGTYDLKDDIVLRNTSRGSGC